MVTWDVRCRTWDVGAGFPRPDGSKNVRDVQCTTYDMRRFVARDSRMFHGFVKCLERK